MSASRGAKTKAVPIPIEEHAVMGAVTMLLSDIGIGESGYVLDGIKVGQPGPH